LYHAIYVDRLHLLLTILHLRQEKDGMRKPRDYDSELQALNERARALRERKVHQLGALVIETGADTLSLDMLAGALICAVETADEGTKEGWRRRGAAFFRPARRSSRRAAADSRGATQSGRAASSLSGEQGS
jgi:hypothetical protein